jgi:signal transduction histidine kinase
MSNGITPILKKEYRRLNWLALIIFAVVLIIHIGAYLVLPDLLPQRLQGDWLIYLVISSVVILLATGSVLFAIDHASERINRFANQLFDRELGHLRAAQNRAKSLRAMASTLRATLSFERVVEEALDVCSLAMEEMGIPKQSLVGAVFLFNGDELVPVTARLFAGSDYEKSIPGKKGIIGAALKQAEPMVTDNPRQDAELRAFKAFHNCVTAVCVPLRAGFQIFGAMVIGSGTAVQFTEDHFELFNSVADQAVIALQNAQLYQRLEEEKQRLIDADEEARKELARDLHDGPTQSIAAIAMRVNFIRSLVTKDPHLALTELEKVEELAKRTSKEIRGMLFTLRPLVLETQGLGPAIETVMNKLRETDGLNMRLVGGEYGDLLSDNAQSVVFSIVEEALGNARKYARAHLVEVRLWQEDNLFVARVQDDGVGFDTEAVNQNYSSRGSLGMLNMRERADRIDGSLRVESALKRGTTVTLVVPLDKNGRRLSIA